MSAGRVFRRCKCTSRCRHTWNYVIDQPRGPGGKRRQMAKGGFATKREAEAALHAAVAAARSGVDSGRGRDRLDGYLSGWLTSKRNLRPTARKSYRAHIDNYLAPHLGHIRLSDLRATHLDEMYAQLLDPERNPPLTAATVRRIHATLRNALNGAIRQRLIVFNPATAVDLPAEHRPPVTVWTPEQSARFLAFTAEDRLAALWHIALMVGLRRSELVALRWDDVDFAAAELHVVEAVTVADRQMHVGRPKTKRSARVVALDEGTLAALRMHRRRQAEERLAWGAAWRGGGRVFVREDGVGLNPDYVTRRFAVLTRLAALPRIRLHDTRHTSASLALAAGVPLKVVSDRLGHATVNVTADIYSHVTPAVAREAAEKIASLVRQSVRLV